MTKRILLLATLVAAGLGLTTSAWASDLDGDGVLDANDVCCNTPTGISVDATGRPLGDLDVDCDVDLVDFAIMIGNITGPLAPVACPSCSDTIQNGNETDVDCGGGTCPACADGLTCAMGTDCQSLVCQFSTCQAPSCSDGVQNGFETGVDCGGPCAPCGLANGASCTFNAECLSNNCVDAFCCNTACAATCQACDVPGSIGTCANIPNGEDPDFECSGATTCNGAGGCTSLLPNGSSCTSGSQCNSGNCVDAVCCNSACGGLCQACNNPGSVGTCSNISNGTDPASECAGATTCNGAGGCTSLLPNGSSCTLGGQCSSGQCVDAVCCNTACTGLCNACNIPGSVGNCSNIPNGTDPAAECAGPSNCNGAGGCTP